MWTVCSAPWCFRPVGNSKTERKWRKRKPPRPHALQPAVPTERKVAKIETTAAENEEELGVVKIEPDDDSTSPEDSAMVCASIPLMHNTHTHTHRHTCWFVLLEVLTW